jgi:hypothetical protein
LLSCLELLAALLSDVGAGRRLLTTDRDALSEYDLTMGCEKCRTLISALASALAEAVAIQQDIVSRRRAGLPACPVRESFQKTQPNAGGTRFETSEHIGQPIGKTPGQFPKTSRDQSGENNDGRRSHIGDEARRPC